MLAIEHAHHILDLFENLRAKEMPPEWMWPFDDEVGQWLEDVMAERERGRGGGREDDDEEVPLTDNEDPAVVDLMKRAGKRR